MRRIFSDEPQLPPMSCDRRRALVTMGAGAVAGLLPSTSRGDAAVALRSLSTLENQHIAVTVRSDGTFTFRDKAGDATWMTMPVAAEEATPLDLGHGWPRSERTYHDGYPARFVGDASGDRMRFQIIGRQGKRMGSFSCQVRLDGPWVEVALLDIDEQLPNLVFPGAIVSESLLIPRGVGRWIRKPLEKRYFWTNYGHLAMRFFGGLRGDKGWLAVFGEGNEDGGVMATELAASPGWVQTLGRWPGRRVVRYRFTTGGYVGVARAFRAFAVAEKLHRPLTEKLRACPPLRNLHGGRILSFYQGFTRDPKHAEEQFRAVDSAAPRGFQVALTHAEVVQRIAEARKLGVKRAMAVARGWIAGGYDWSHPDIWPPAPELGTVDELRRLCATPDPVTVALHDNYMDIYEQSASFPKGTFRTKTGDPMPGGHWTGGQAYLVNTRNAVANLKRNWEQLKTLAPRGFFIDTTTAVALYQSWEEGNTLTRAQDRQHKQELLTFLKKRGVAVGSEEGIDFGIPWVDWLENRHERVAGESVPLWPLVFHDAVFCARYYQKSGAASPSAPGWLPDLLWGYNVLAGVGGGARAKTWDADRFRASLVVDNWHARVGTAAMTNHRYLTDDFQVEETEFSSGHSIIVNFAADVRTVNGVTVPAGGYVMRG